MHNFAQLFLLEGLSSVLMLSLLCWPIEHISPIHKDTVIRDFNGVPSCLSAFAVFSFTNRASARAIIQGSSHSIPNFHEKSSVVGFAQPSLGMVDVMLIRGVDLPIMRAQPINLMTTVDENAIAIEKRDKYCPQQILIHWEYHWDQKQRECSHKLVDVLISDDSKRCWVEKHVVVLVLEPAGLDCVAESVIVPF